MPHTRPLDPTYSHAHTHTPPRPTLHRRQDAGQDHLVAMYVGTLGDNAVERYTLFITSLGLSVVPAQRRLALMRASWSRLRSTQSSARSTCSRPYACRTAPLDALRDAEGDRGLHEFTRIRHIFVLELVLRLHVLLLESRARIPQCRALIFLSNTADRTLPMLTARSRR